MTIRALTSDDWPAVKRIFEAGIATKQATFETQSPTWDGWNGSHLAGGRFVAEIDGEIVGWVAFSPTSDRCVYGGVVENSVYIDPAHAGKGIGRTLLNAAIEWSETNDIWTIQAGIFPENEASVRLHQSCGFRIVGNRERLGKMDGSWRDVLLLERRSKVAGK
ncbi:MAG: L-methionine sulfoximine/L-methionine sulfone acetyltransferase [Fimbriimonadaceae bacterium]|nr:L-methionine sulfoximine/L-methionine sulfone acetyltransferase [Fimbriimonadaceae bacterium]